MAACAERLVIVGIRLGWRAWQERVIKLVNDACIRILQPHATKFMLAHFMAHQAVGICQVVIDMMRSSLEISAVRPRDRVAYDLTACARR